MKDWQVRSLRNALALGPVYDKDAKSLQLRPVCRGDPSTHCDDYCNGGQCMTESEAAEYDRVLHMTPDFKPTHRHAEGGLYQLLERIVIHVGEDQWTDGVLYRNESGQKFARPLFNFNKRFKEIK